MDNLEVIRNERRRERLKGETREQGGKIMIKR